MIDQARKRYPSLRFVVADGGRLPFAEVFDAVFSNAALHWMKEPEQVVTCIASVLKRVKALARSRKASANRVMVDLIQEGLESAENERRRFFELADRLSTAADPAERRRLKAELARMTFGE